MLSIECSWIRLAPADSFLTGHAEDIIDNCTHTPHLSRLEKKTILSEKTTFDTTSSSKAELLNKVPFAQKHRLR